MTTPNVPLLKQTLDYVETHPEEWTQRFYRCGTGMCFAGWAAVLDGGTWYDAELKGPWIEDMVARPDDPDLDVFLMRDGARTVDVECRARRILGLTEDEASELFDGDNTLDDLRRIVRELCEAAS